MHIFLNYRGFGKRWRSLGDFAQSTQPDRTPARIASGLVNRNTQTGRLSWRHPFETHPAQLPVDTPHFTGVGVDINLDISA
jgi:hypothetical protein